jgi:hypothetical protein
VNQNRPGAAVRFSASIEEKRHGMWTSRGVEGRQPAGAFAFDPLLRSAHLAPSGPFSGEAVFRREAAPRKRWTGDLAVDFPGRPGVRLAGAGIRAGLVHARVTKEPIRPSD